MPRISIAAHQADGDAIYGTLGRECVGYGLHQAWIFSMFFSSNILFGTDTVLFSAADTNSSVSLVYFISIITYLVVLLGFDSFSRRLNIRHMGKGMLVVAGLGACAGSLLAFSCSFTGQIALAFEIISGLSTGACSALLLLQWATVYARMHNNITVMINTSLSLPATVLIYALVIMQTPFPLAGIITSSLPLFEMVLLWTMLPDTQSQKKTHDKPCISHISTSLLFTRLGIPLFFCGFAIGFLRIASFGASDATGYTHLMLFAAAALACIINLAFTFFLSSHDTHIWELLFKATVTVAFIAIVFTPGLFIGNAQFSSFVTSLGYFCIGSFMWAFLAGTSQSYRLSPYAVFGMGRGLMALASLLVGIAPALVDFFSAPFSNNTYAYVALVFICLLAGFMLMPSSRQFSNLLSEKSPAHNADDDRHADTGQDDTTVHDKSALPHENLLEDASSSRTSSTNNVSDHLEVSFDKKTLHLAADATQTVVQSPLTEVKSQTIDMDTLSKHCELVSNRYLLSQRETEVLFLLALGRNSAYIQKALYISEGTAKTHIRHIYRKTGVHKQQDLIELVEQGI